MIIRTLTTLFFLGLMLSACVSGHEVGMRLPIVMGGEPSDAPPPRGTPAYDEWIKTQPR